MADRDPETGQFILGHTGLGGRPAGARNRLGMAFIEAMEADFNQHGVQAIIEVRKERPHEYLKIIAGLLPKEFHITDDTLDEMSDDELLGIIAGVRSLIAKQVEQGGTIIDGEVERAPTENTAQH